MTQGERIRIYQVEEMELGDEERANNAKNISFLSLHVIFYSCSIIAFTWIHACYRMKSLTVDLANPSSRISCIYNLYEKIINGHKN